VRFVKKKVVFVALLLTFSVVIGFSSLAGADSSGSPGSTSDPLVTRSFVEKYVQELVSKMAPSGGGSLEWSVAELMVDEEFIGKAGTEFIVRGGQVVVVDPTGGGIPDLTAGKNVAAGQVAESNHLFSIPRSDGRGIKAAKPTIIMYRGF